MNTNVPATYQEDLARAARAAANRHPVNDGEFLSFRGGQMSYNNERLPGDQACVIIVADVFENSYFERPFDPNRPEAPTCYAFGDTKDDMGPHPSMQADLSYFKPQSPTWKCNGCPWNEFGSALQGAGKRCKNGVRLALLPAGQYTPRPGSRDFDLRKVTDLAHFQTAPLAFAKLAVGSTREFNGYVQRLASTRNLPPFGAITRMWVEPDPKYQFVTKYEMIEAVPEGWLGAIFQRHTQSKEELVRGYSPPKQ